MSNGNNPSRFPAVPNGGWVGVLKTILQSQVGGWVFACVVFGFMGYWLIKDREAVYRDLANLRENAMPAIIENRKVAMENQVLLQQILKRLNEKPEAP